MNGNRRTNELSAYRNVPIFFARYPEFAERIRNKEFDIVNDPLEAVRVWDAEYGAAIAGTE